MSIGTIYVPSQPLLSCAACGAVPSITGDPRCACTIADLLAATVRPHDHGPTQCQSCGRPGAVIDDQCFVCAGVSMKHARDER